MKWRKIRSVYGKVAVKNIFPLSLKPLLLYIGSGYSCVQHRKRQQGGLTYNHTCIDVILEQKLIFLGNQLKRYQEQNSQQQKMPIKITNKQTNKNTIRTNELKLEQLKNGRKKT